ncbi:hypothetical protein WA026_000709 [Henosepilachna vigintioctopunctata]|uniref:Rab3 GTPase-activating protein catalytic subunit n=1 Tax=Henosepilachna vigintioctopunctata TaxID=420089 RepID=A0AAW1V1A5_9CUCU
MDVMPSFELPFGVTIDPINLLQLKTTWLDVPSFNVYDNESLSFFKPELSHQWSILVQINHQPVCILTDCLLDYLSLLNNESRVYDILLELSPIDALVESKVTNIPSILSKAARNSITGSRKEGSVISEEVLVSILYYLFPDAEQHEPKNPYNLMSENELNDPSNTPQKTSIQDLDKQCRGFKTCPHDSLLWRFAVISAILQHTGGGFRAFAQLWYEFIQEMRYRWDKNIIISG